MSALRNLIAQLEAEDEQRKKEDEKCFEEQYKKHKEMMNKITVLADESKRCMDNVTKGLDQLVANKHTIEQAVKQTENLTGLPIPQEHHGNIIELISGMTGFMNKIESINNQSMVSPSEIHQNVISVTQKVSDELQSARNKFVDTETLYHKIQHFKELAADDDDCFVDDTLDFEQSTV